MVDESLIAHLKRTAGEELEPQLRQLLQYTDDDVELTEEQRMAIMQSLYHCKILDPACGSGAFPMGILQQMVYILAALTLTMCSGKNDDAAGSGRYDRSLQKYIRKRNAKI